MEISYSIRDDLQPEEAGYTSEEWPSRPEPTIGPGQIWIVEQASGATLSALHRNALGRANVVLYDRALAPMVARVLPIGTYAEPLPVDRDAGGPAIAPRAWRFATEGWSVVQLVEARGGWRRRLPEAADAILRRDGGGNLPFQAITTTGAKRSRRCAGRLRDLAVLADEFDDDDFLTLILGPLVVRHPAPGDAFTANGLAG